MEGTRRFDLLIRFPLKFRDTQEDIESIIIDTPSGGKVHLGQLAKVENTRGTVMINREGGRRVLLCWPMSEAAIWAALWKRLSAA